MSYPLHERLRDSPPLHALAAYALILAAALAAGIATLRPSAAELPNGPREIELSRHVHQIAAKPHPLGSC